VTNRFPDEKQINKTYLQFRFCLLAGHRGRRTGGSLGIIGGVLGRTHRRRQRVPGASKIGYVQAGSVLWTHSPPAAGSMSSPGTGWTHVIRTAGRSCESRGERADTTGTWTAPNATGMATRAVRAAASGTATAASTAAAMMDTLILLALLLGRAWVYHRLRRDALRGCTRGPRTPCHRRPSRFTWSRCRRALLLPVVAIRRSYRLKKKMVMMLRPLPRVLLLANVNWEQRAKEGRDIFRERSNLFTASILSYLETAARIN